MVRVRWIGGDETRSNSECTHKRRTAAAGLEENRGTLVNPLVPATDDSPRPRNAALASF